MQMVQLTLGLYGHVLGRSWLNSRFGWVDRTQLDQCFVIFLYDFDPDEDNAPLASWSSFKLMCAYRFRAGFNNNEFLMHCYHFVHLTPEENLMGGQ